MNIDELKLKVGENLRRARSRAGLSQRAITGVTARYYQDLEAGARNPSLEVLAILADQFGVTVADLVNVPGARAGNPPLDKIEVGPSQRSKSDRQPKGPRSR